MIQILTDTEIGLTRVVPELTDFTHSRARHLNMTGEEPIFLLSPQTFTDFIERQEIWETIVHSELGEGARLDDILIFPDSSVDEGVIEIMRARG